MLKEFIITYSKFKDKYTFKSNTKFITKQDILELSYINKHLIIKLEKCYQAVIQEA